MSNKNDPITDRETVRLWFRRYDGLTVFAVKYSDPYGGQMAGLHADPEKVAELAPIYVGLSSHEPQRLDEVLTELEHLREFKNRYETHKAESFDDKYEELRNKIAILERKPKWKFW